MLRLEQSSKGIHVRLNPENHFFNQSLLEALAIALAIHLGAFFLFHIQPFHMTSSYRFPPVHVQTQPNPLLDGQTIVSKQERLLNSEISSPPFSLPSLDFFPLLISQKSDIPPVSADLSSFKSLEQRVLSFSHSPSTIPSLYQPLQIFLSGPLAQKQLLHHPASSHSIISQRKMHYFQNTYEVQVDPKTGSIFWYVKKQASKRKDVNQQAERYLLELQFARDFSDVGWIGQVDILLAVEEDD
jgi:hypothetical protein